MQKCSASALHTGGIKCAWRVSPTVNVAVSTDELQREEELPPHRGTGQ